MAKSSVSKKQVKKAEWRGYHQVNLTAEDDAAFDAWLETVTEEFPWLDHLADDGYKISFSFDSYHSGISAALYCTQEKMAWAGYSLTAWGENSREAYLMLCYKHFVMCNQIWEVAANVPEKAYKKRG
jgi:hypothetical protein